MVIKGINMTYETAEGCQIENLQEIYSLYFHGKTDGYFVEIGAYDGILFSNTWGLARAGWKGICVEPIHELAERCRENHRDNKIETVEAAISECDGVVSIFLGPVPTSPNGTIDSDIMNRDLWGFHSSDTRTVNSMRLDTLLSMNQTPVGFDLLVIDVEGGEIHVIQSFDWSRWRPRMIIIESNINSDQIKKWFNDTTYHLIQDDGLNSIYIMD